MEGQSPAGFRSKMLKNQFKVLVVSMEIGAMYMIVVWYEGDAFVNHQAANNVGCSYLSSPH